MAFVVLFALGVTSVLVLVRAPEHQHRSHAEREQHHERHQRAHQRAIHDVRPFRPSLARPRVAPRAARRPLASFARIRRRDGGANDRA